MTGNAGKSHTGRQPAGARIGHITTVPIPSRQTDTEQVVRSVDALWAAGVDVDLIVPASLATRERAPGEAVRGFYHVRGRFAVLTYRCMRRIALEAERVVCAVIAASRFVGKYDIVHTRSRGVALISLMKRCPVVFETYRDLTKNWWWFLALLRIVGRSRNFLGIITHSHFAASAIGDVPALAGKVHVVHNGYDPAVFVPLLGKDAARQRLGFERGEKLVVYAGNVQRGKGMSMVLDIAEQLGEVRFVFVGGAREHLDDLSERIDKRGLANVVLAGWKGHDALGVYLQAADILIIPPTARPLERYGRTVLPMKTFLLAGAGRVVVAPKTPDICEVLNDENAVLVPPDDASVAAREICAILANRQRARQLGRAARETARQFTWAARALKLKKLYQMWQDENRQEWP